MLSKLMRSIAVLATAAFILVGTSANATTIYFAGGEDSDFTSVGAPSLDQTAGRFRSGYARGDLSTSLSLGCGNCQYWAAQDVINGATGEANFWWHTRLFTNYTSGTGNGGNKTIIFFDGSNIARLALENNGGGFSNPISNFSMHTLNAAGTDTSLGNTSCTISANPSTPDYVDIHITNYGTSSTGNITIYIDNTQCFTYTGTIFTDSASTLSGFEFGPSVPNFSSAVFAYSEIIVSDTDTRSMSLVTNYPQGNGNTQAWTCTGGTNYGSVNAFNTVAGGFPNNCNSGTASQLEEFSGSATACPTGNWAVFGVLSSILGAYNTGGPQGIEHDIRTGGTSYQGSNIAQAQSYQTSQNVWITNPGTSAPWTCSQLNSVNFGAESHT